MTMSLSITVGILLAAMIITVHSANSCLITLCRIASVVESIEVVTSSRTRILFLLSSTLPRKKLHHCLYSHKLNTEFITEFTKEKVKKDIYNQKKFFGFYFSHLL
jgi:UDP-N-acetylmuramyl pentapeptide phosphotransferase/UDP-N-acetylglucosamine-1-phosphate transferase